MPIEAATIKDVFLAAVDIASPDERAAYLDRACAGNPELRRRIAALLAAHERPESILDHAALPAADALATVNQPLLERPGTVIGPYKLLQQIGEGGMGTVYMAEQSHPVQRKVALKVIKAGMDSGQVIARFEAERQALAMMDHVNIARVLDAGATDAGRPYFVMELVHGVPITKYCDDNHLTPRERMELFVPVCHAIQHAHQKGIIHRDVKPSNVMITLYDGKPVPKVIDFGVAKATEQKLTERTLFTQYGTMVGTLEYMSPEQAEMSALGVDTRSDIYSLGVLLYELLTGSTPLSHKRVKEAAYAEILRMIKEEEPPKPSTRLSDSGEALASISAQRHMAPAKLTKLVRGELDWIVMKTLEKDRNRRYETPNGLAADVQRYLADEPVQACPPSAGYRFRKFVRRNKTKLVSVGVVSMALLATLGAIGWAAWDRQHRIAEQVRQQAAQNEKLSIQVRAIVTDVERLERQEKWAEALATARRAEAALAAGGGGDPDINAEVGRHLDDLRRVETVENARLIRGGNEWHYDFEAADRGFVAAFESLGIPVRTLPAEEVGRRIRAHPAIAPALIAALDDWMSVCRARAYPESRELIVKHLIESAQAADEDPFRGRIRDALLGNDHKTLEAMATAPDLTRHSATTMYLLAATLPTPNQRIELLRSAQNEQPQEFWLNVSLGVNLSSSRPERYPEAVPFLQTAVALRPQSLVRPILGYALFRAGQKEEARLVLEKSIQLHPRLATSYMHLSDVLHSLGKLDEAIAAAGTAIELDPVWPMPHANLSWFLHETGDLDESIAAAKKAIELWPRTPWAYCNLGIALRKQGNLEDAAEALRKAIEHDPHHYRWHWELGLILVKQGQVDEAIACWRKAIELDPQHASVHGSLGNALKAQGKLDEALAAYRQALELDPKYAAPHNNLAIELAGRKKLDEALAALRKVIELNPKNASSHNNLGSALRQQGKLDEAITCYKRAIELEPGSTLFHDGLGYTLAEKGMLDEAVACYKRALELDPHNHGVRQRLGSVLQKQGKLDEAVALYRQGLELGPDTGKYYYSFLSVSLQQVKPDEAIALYREVIERRPDDARFLGALGRLLERHGKLDEAAVCFQRAIAAYQEAIERDPTLAAAHRDLGAILCRHKQDYHGAIAAYNEALRLQPDNAAAHFGLASALALSQQWDRSASVYAEALQQLGTPLWPGPWYEAIRSDEVFTRLTALTALRPDDRLPWIMRARLHVLQRDWKRAAADYSRVNESLASIDQAKLLREADDLIGYACLLLLLGDRPGYEQFCKKWADRVGPAQGWEYSLARAWAVSPRTVVPAQQIVEWARKAVQARRDVLSLHVLSLAHYRSGEFDLAIELAKESNAGNWRGGEKALNWLVLAMAHHRLGQAAEARTSLEQALQLAGRASPMQRPGVEWPDMAPPDLLEFELLRREADDLIDPKSPEKQ